MSSSSNRVQVRGGILGFIYRDKVAALICASPFIIGFVVFLLIPMLLSLYYSFTNFNITRPPRWVGFDNYNSLLTGRHSEQFWNSLVITFRYTVLSVPLRLIMALFVAILLLRTSKLTGVLRAVYYLPSMLGGSIAVAYLWRMIFRPDGVVNSFISLFAPGFDYHWINEPASATFVLVLLAVWQFGSAMLIFLASLKQIPEQLYEAADIDGANRVRKFFKVTLPLLTPTIFFNLVLQTINGLLVFTQVFIIFGQRGFPLGSTRVYALQMFRHVFEFREAGIASAMAWFMLVFIAIFTGVLFLTKRFWVYDEGGA